MLYIKYIKIQTENFSIYIYGLSLKEIYKESEDFIINKEKEFIEHMDKKDDKLKGLEKSFKIISDEYESEIIRINKLLNEKENQSDLRKLRSEAEKIYHLYKS